MFKFKQLTCLFVVLSLFGCNSDSEKQPSDEFTSDVTVDDFAGSIHGNAKVLLSSGDTTFASNYSFQGDINSQVTISGTDPVRTLLVRQEDLDINHTNLEESTFIAWVTKTSTNGDLIFGGEILVVKKALLSAIKQALNASPQEIDQATIDAQVLDIFFTNLSFSFTFHQINNKYWQQPQDLADKFATDRPLLVAVPDSNAPPEQILTLKEYFDSTNLPETVLVALLGVRLPDPTSGNTAIELQGGYNHAPKSIIDKIKAALPPSGSGALAKEESWSSWTKLESFTLSFSPSNPLQ